MTDSVDGSPQLRSFVEQVQRASGTSSPAEAEVLVRATLRTLGESITGGQMDELATYLPSELRDEAQQRSGQARKMDKTGFLDRVSGDLLTKDLETTEHQVRAVLSTLRSWSDSKEIDDTLAQLPNTITDLFRTT